MRVIVCERCKPERIYSGVRKIEKKEFHIFVTISDGTVCTHELDDIQKIEVEL